MVAVGPSLPCAGGCEKGESIGPEPGIVELFEPCNGLWRLQLISVVDAEALGARRSARGDGNQPPRKKAAQKFMPDNDFKALAALSRNFFRADLSNS
jgi:hypothetical protein